MFPSHPVIFTSAPRSSAPLRLAQPEVCQGLLYASTTTPAVACIVIADAWPSWFFICAASSLQCSYVLLTSLHHPWLPVLQHHYPTTKWMLLTPAALSNVLMALPDYHIVLIQGPCFSTLPPSLCHRPWLWSSPPSSLTDLDVSYHLSLTHFQSGGVLTGSWLFRSNCPFHLEPSPPLPPSSRRLRHIMNTATTRGGGVPSTHSSSILR